MIIKKLNIYKLINYINNYLMRKRGADERNAGGRKLIQDRMFQH